MTEDMTMEPVGGHAVPLTCQERAVETLLDAVLEFQSGEDDNAPVDDAYFVAQARFQVGKLAEAGLLTDGD